MQIQISFWAKICEFAKTYKVCVFIENNILEAHPLLNWAMSELIN